MFHRWIAASSVSSLRTNIRYLTVQSFPIYSDLAFKEERHQKYFYICIHLCLRVFFLLCCNVQIDGSKLRAVVPLICATRCLKWTKCKLLCFYIFLCNSVFVFVNMFVFINMFCINLCFLQIGGSHSTSLHNMLPKVA